MCNLYSMKSNQEAILTRPDEMETWMTAPAEEALKLQRALPDGRPNAVARGVKKDGLG